MRILIDGKQMSGHVVNERPASAILSLAVEGVECRTTICIRPTGQVSKKDWYTNFSYFLRIGPSETGFQLLTSCASLAYFLRTGSLTPILSAGENRLLFAGRSLHRMESLLTLLRSLQPSWVADDTTFWNSDSRQCRCRIETCSLCCGRV